VACGLQRRLRLGEPAPPRLRGWQRGETRSVALVVPTLSEGPGPLEAGSGAAN